jgi:hypothetical protein
LMTSLVCLQYTHVDVYTAVLQTPTLMCIQQYCSIHINVGVLQTEGADIQDLSSM